ncbi:hypothetical protein [Polluticoccus soli]|uniref:hypothetical protein n=1 Tax=Polluticoccus soli TaxID=3034150 RepID=UPI0023E18ED2|nr:hypothetical protein [Flavipsychrobacter sp. JY13-12]
MRYFLLIALAFYFNAASGQEIKGSFKLQRIDSSLLDNDGYYLLEFKKRSARYYFLSKKSSSVNGELIQIGKKYKLTAAEMIDYVNAGGLHVTIAGRWFVIFGENSRPILDLKAGEYLYSTNCISGLYFVCEKNK